MLYLASKSPRRAELLRQIGIEPRLLDVDVAEIRAPGEPPEDYVRRVARDKARAGAALLADQGASAADADAVVLGADTEVVLADEVFGKPADAADAAAMLERLAGREHRVISAVCCVGAGREAAAMQVSEVAIAALSPADIERYVASGEAFGKAGAYAIQGRAAVFIAHLSGSHSSVMGLPLHETAALLRTFGIRI